MKLPPIQAVFRIEMQYDYVFGVWSEAFLDYRSNKDTTLIRGVYEGEIISYPSEMEPHCVISHYCGPEQFLRLREQYNSLYKDRLL